MKLRLPLCTFVSSLVGQGTCCAAREGPARLGLNNLPSQQVVHLPQIPQIQGAEYTTSDPNTMSRTGHTGAPPPPFVPPEEPLSQFATWGGVIDSLVHSGHHKWGFLVYRTSYDDDAAWQRYLQILNRSTWLGLNNENQLRMLPYLSYTPMEDRDLFEGASKDRIREHFRQWVATRSVERDGPGADHPDLIELLPRYRICMFTDKGILSATSIEEIEGLTTPFALIQGRAVLIDSQFGQHQDYGGMDDIPRPPVEGKTNYDVGWMYIQLQFTANAYNLLCSGGSEEWEPHRGFYTRPPDCWG
ncbi:hypothetical protein B0T14DRAFT_517607 [Immersiella caudata]|uniref:Uncharacterized protein n=1 Tax=Immersiella caudata TaxID=314043 RepID=A0AA39WZE9_9PEZI|nr:hypothetical protein B0T14DRAFT_517607 [Immersiella caudata]